LIAAHVRTAKGSSVFATTGALLSTVTNGDAPFVSHWRGARGRRRGARICFDKDARVGDDRVTRDRIGGGCDGIQVTDHARAEKV
jgi:hypothetical protein